MSINSDYSSAGDIRTIMAKIEAERHRDAYAEQVRKEFENMGMRSAQDGKRNVAGLKQQNLVRTLGADPTQAANLVGMNTGMNGFWLPAIDDKVF